MQLHASSDKCRGFVIVLRSNVPDLTPCAFMRSRNGDCILARRGRNRILNSSIFAARNGPVDSCAGSVSGRKEIAGMGSGCPHTPARRRKTAARAREICWGRNLLSGGVLAAVEGSCPDFGDVLSFWNSSTTRPGPSTAASTPALRTPPVGGLECDEYRLLRARLWFASAKSA